MRKDDLEVLEKNVQVSFVTLLKRTTSYKDLKSLMVLFSVVDYLFVKLRREENERKN